MNWSTEWPTEPGLYWFYGCPYNFDVISAPLEYAGKWATLCVVRVFLSGKTPVYLTEQGEMYRYSPRCTRNPKEVARGVWMPIVTPENLPSNPYLMED